MREYEKNRRTWLMIKVALGVAAVAVVVGLGFWAYRSAQARDLNKVPAGVVSYSYKSGQHDETYTAWPESPPVGGIHNPVWQNCGVYDAPIGKGNAIHSLEHGAVWINYRPDLPQDQIDTLKKLTNGNNYTIVSPYPDLYAPIVATAWNKQLPIQNADDKALKQFAHVFKNSAKYTPEFGARCSGGVDTTVSQ